MDYNYSDLQKMLLDTAERFLRSHYTLEHRRALRKSPDGLDADAWAQFAELGWLALAIPEEQGGLDGEITDIAVLMTAFGANLVPDPIVSTAVTAPYLLSHADQPDSDLFEAIISGEARVALAHDEPGERYAYSAPRKTLLSKTGNGYTISGEKQLVIDAPSATHLIVTAQIEGSGDFALALVPATQKEVSAYSYNLIDSARASDVKFNKAEATAVLLTGPKASSVFGEAIDRTSIAYGAQAVGSMESALQICSAYIKERQQFGQPIGKFQALQHIMADMFVATHQARSALYQALAQVDAPERDRQRAVSLAKITIGEASQLVSKQGIQLHGGYGLTDEYEISHHYRRLTAIEKLYGDIDHHVRRIGAMTQTA